MTTARERDWLRDGYGMVRGRWIALIVLAGVLAMVSVAVVGVSYVEATKCERLEDGLRRDTEYRFLGGCYVALDDGRRVPEALYRFNEEAP